MSAVDALGLVAQQLSQLAQLDPRMADTAILADTLQSQAYDLARDLRTYREGVEYNPRRLAQIEERLTLILGLKRKYGATIAEVLAYGERARAGLHDIVTSDERREQLRVRLSDLTDLIGAQAAQLSLARRGAARRLAAAVQREIADLRLTGGRFAVHFACRPDDDGVPAALPEAALLEAEGQEIAQPSPAGRRKWRVGDPPPVGASAPIARLS